AGRAGMDIAFLSARILGCVGALAIGGRRNRARARGQRIEDRIEMIDDRLLAADHHAIAALQPPDATRGADIDIADALFGARLRAADIVLIEAVTAIDDDVAL